MSNSIPQVRFPRPAKESFRRVLSTRVRDYFKEQNLSNKATPKMVGKSVAMLSLYFVPYLALLMFASGAWSALGLFVLMGFGMAGIGMSIMHDAAHGAYHKNELVNKWLANTIYLISGNLSTWKLQHNVLHHTYTNIEGMDEDLETSGLIRLHPSQEWKGFHRFQKIYSPLVYGLLTLNWVTAKDFKQLLRYYKMGLGGHTSKTIRKEWITLILTKLLYFGLFLALPLILSPVAWYWIIAGFVLMHFTAGVILSFVFQLAHMVEGVENMDIPADGQIKDEWMEHQLRTTANFARKSRLVSWYVGGLNFQIEHHLFPNICHIHYPEISKIVQKTAQEFNLPYFEYGCLRDALQAHMSHLAKMAKPEPQLA
ncbi:MAG: acyl-CoA desaturase [Owenweeksia sp.]|nr:acyl-CoA desaturase [Owenweeksia sp.]